MSIPVHHTAQIDHAYEPLYLAIHGHCEKPGGGFDFSHRRVRG